MLIYMLKINNKLVTEDWGLPKMYRTKRAAVIAGNALMCNPNITAETTVSIYTEDGFVQSITPRYGIKHHYEHFVLLTMGFNVAKAWHMIPKARKTEPIQIENLYNAFLADEDIDLIHINTKYAMTDEVDITVPLLIAQLNPTKSMVINGWHRIYKAHKLGVATLPAFVLSLSETKEIKFS